MKRNAFLAVIFALLLAACTWHGPDTRKLDPDNPQVSVVDGKITIDQETVHFGKEKKNFKITWSLPADSPYRFAKNDGIFIIGGGDEFYGCHQEENGVRFSCMNRNSKPGRNRYKYNIAVEGSPAVRPLDPIIDNDNL